MTTKVLCDGSDSTPRECRKYGEEVLAQCKTCERILKARRIGGAVGSWWIGQHSVVGRNTASYDNTLGILWSSESATPEPVNTYAFSDARR